MELYVIACTDISLEAHVIAKDITISMAIKHACITAIMCPCCNRYRKPYT